MDTDLSKLTINQLRSRASKLGLGGKGSKVELVTKLEKYYTNEKHSPKKCNSPPLPSSCERHTTPTNCDQVVSTDSAKKITERVQQGSIEMGHILQFYNQMSSRFQSLYQISEQNMRSSVDSGYFESLKFPEFPKQPIVTKTSSPIMVSSSSPSLGLSSESTATVSPSTGTGKKVRMKTPVKIRTKTPVKIRGESTGRTPSTRMAPVTSKKERVMTSSTNRTTRSVRVNEVSSSQPDPTAATRVSRSAPSGASNARSTMSTNQSVATVSRKKMSRVALQDKLQKPVDVMPDPDLLELPPNTPAVGNSAASSIDLTSSLDSSSKVPLCEKDPADLQEKLEEPKVSTVVEKKTVTKQPTSRLTTAPRGTVNKAPTIETSTKGKTLLNTAVKRGAVRQDPPPSTVKKTSRSVASSEPPASSQKSQRSLRAPVPRSAVKECSGAQSSLCHTKAAGTAPKTCASKQVAPSNVAASPTAAAKTVNEENSSSEEKEASNPLAWALLSSPVRDDLCKQQQNKTEPTVSEYNLTPVKNRLVTPAPSVVKEQKTVIEKVPVYETPVVKKVAPAGLVTTSKKCIPPGSVSRTPLSTISNTSRGTLSTTTRKPGVSAITNTARKHVLNQSVQKSNRATSMGLCAPKAPAFTPSVKKAYPVFSGKSTGSVLIPKSAMAPVQRSTLTGIKPVPRTVSKCIPKVSHTSRPTIVQNKENQHEPQEENVVQESAAANPFLTLIAE